MKILLVSSSLKDMDALILKQQRSQLWGVWVVLGKCNYGWSPQRQHDYLGEIQWPIEVRHDSHPRRIDVDQDMVESGEFFSEKVLQVIYVLWARVYFKVDFFDFSFPVRQDVEYRNGAGENSIVDVWSIRFNWVPDPLERTVDNLQFSQAAKLIRSNGFHDRNFLTRRMRFIFFVGLSLWLLWLDAIKQRFQHLAQFINVIIGKKDIFLGLPVILRV